MNTPVGCPCDSVKSIEKRLSVLEVKESANTTNLVAMQKDIEYIKEKVTDRTRFNINVFTAIVQGIITIIMGFIALKLGIR